MEALPGDDAVLETVEMRERAPRLPAEVLLGSEVRELRDTAVYLEATAVAAIQANLVGLDFRGEAGCEPLVLTSDKRSRACFNSR